MKISHVKISNVLGIDELEFSPGGFTTISGPNGTGKTSILSAIKSVTGRGHDATLLRKGAEQGEVVLVLEDGVSLRERVTADKTTRDVLKDGKPLKKPGDTLQSLTDALSVNPVEFLRAPAKDRVKVLLETMPIEVDLEHLSKISGINVAKSNAHPLALIDTVRKQVYDDRTGTNRAIKEKEATINQLTIGMPEAPGGVDGDEDSLSAEVKLADDTRATELDRINTKLLGIQQSNADKKAQLRAETQLKIDALNAELQAKIAAEDAEFERIKGLAGKQREKALQLHADTTAPLNAALAVIRANRDAAAKREQTKKVIEQMGEDKEALEADAASQTKALDAIDAYKDELLASMPIPGLTVQDGEVYLDGIAFDRVNTAKQVEVAFQIAKLRAGDLAVCCLDGLELLDAEHLAELETQAEESDMQVFITRVSERGEFAIGTK